MKKEEKNTELLQNKTEQEKPLTEVKIDQHDTHRESAHKNDNWTAHSNHCSKKAKTGTTTDALAIWELNKRWLATKSNLLIPRKWITKNRLDLKDFRKLNEWLAHRRYKNPKVQRNDTTELGKTLLS